MGQSTSGEVGAKHPVQLLIPKMDTAVYTTDPQTVDYVTRRADVMFDVNLHNTKTSLIEHALVNFENLSATDWQYKLEYAPFEEDEPVGKPKVIPDGELGNLLLNANIGFIIHCINKDGKSQRKLKRKASRRFSIDSLDHEPPQPASDTRNSNTNLVTLGDD